ncbi:Uncharacterized protein APZ42_028339 [Daphnia magna]|uniref:Uncharacterized protein n=1 Tax=Daphnia magna TaxID=35525 RepID=A0A164QQ60_9CRUS|nr:Uncharacterized protein APZ42_028339 [Daphnia magna]
MEHHHFHYNQQQHHQHSQPEHELELEEWHQQLDLEHHIRHCQCSCNHMGYGNYWSYKDNLDKIGDELHMTSNFVKSQPRSSPGSFIGRSEFSSRTPAGYYGQNGGGTIPRSHRRPTQHYSTAAIAESNFLTPSSQTSISGSSRRPGQHPLNGSASMVAEPSLDADDLMNDDSDSASQSSRPGKFISH